MKLDLSRAAWRKSSRSGQTSNCVEVAGNLPGGVAVRDSKRPAGPALMVSRTAWHAFTAGIKAGQCDVRLATARRVRPPAGRPHDPDTQRLRPGDTATEEQTFDWIEHGGVARK